MKSLLSRAAWIVLVFFCSLPLCSAQGEETKEGFGELLKIVDLGPDKLAPLSNDAYSEEEWSTLAQLFLRLQQHDPTDLNRWTIPNTKGFSSEQVGELFRVEGLVVQVEALPLPGEIAQRLEAKQIFRCRVKLNDSVEIVVLSLTIPKRWMTEPPKSEPVSFRGVLLNAGQNPWFLTTHVSWFPTTGLTSGKLLLARFGMDAALWDDVVQRSPFVSAERGREAQAFYACLVALKQVPAAELAKLTLENIARRAATSQPVDSKLQKQIAASIAEQAARGFSSVAPLFLEPEQQVGELVRIEGTARRAVRIAVDEKERRASGFPIDEYFELEVFTADSQNLPLVCCVTSLPAKFPMGDAIRAGVRLDGVFFKSWQYRSRKVVEGPGETATQQQRYTPVILAASVTWLQQAPAMQSWWGGVVGGAIFAAMIFGLARMLISFRQDRRTRLPVDPPNFSEL